MKFLWTTLHVTNLDRSLSFYHDQLQLPIIRQFDGDVRIAFLGEGETQLELIEGPVTASESVSLGFQVDNLDEWIDSLNECYIGPIISPMPGMRFAFFQDPDKHQIQLVEMRQHA